MIIIGATALATLACQACVQTPGGELVATTTAPAIIAPTKVYPGEVSTALPTNEVPSTNLQFQSTVSEAEAFPRLAFEAPETYLAPIAVNPVRNFSTTRLYSSSALTNLAADRETEVLSPVPRDTRNVSAEIALSASGEQTGLGFDVGIAPRVSFERDGAFETRRFGGEVRIGQNFDQRGEGGAQRSWYLFAGADGEALVWEPDDIRSMSASDMALHDKVTVGDMQAGVSFQQGPGELSFSYIRREVEYRERNLGASENEDFAGLSFTIRR